MLFVVLRIEPMALYVASNCFNTETLCGISLLPSFKVKTILPIMPCDNKIQESWTGAWGGFTGALKDIRFWYGVKGLGQNVTTKSLLGL